ncbi:hypothetical protein J5N97_008440 [Dioscorea zingiberensis]|uniref:14-3-3 domain-containing protein n=1 Tax=Dioscorea zingiberensis TaxID=325984 RepID=A0A9D5CXN5_9LILI|nr:hypothetical protein J5N97_008440 [Dioscorea zingiberensis]
MEMQDREVYVFIAKLAEQAERYEEMVEIMKKVAQLDQELTVEERNLLSVGYKNVIGARRASWRIISSVQQEEESKGNELLVNLIKGNRQKVEEELTIICNDLLALIEAHLIPSSKSPESFVFYYKIACYLAQQAFDEAIAHLRNVNGECYMDSTLILRLLRDNLILWTTDVTDEEDDGADDCITSAGQQVPAFLFSADSL